MTSPLYLIISCSFKKLMWFEIINKVLSLPPHTDIIVSPKIPLPPNAKRTLGEAKGQIADWEITLSDGKRIHIVEFEDRYEIHWDIVSPRVDPLKHLRIDAPHWYEFIKSILMFLRLKI